MLKKRSRSKQALMADTNKSQTQKQSKLTPFPRLFTAFSSFKSFTENDAVASPTSILDTIPFSVLKNPFVSDNPKTHDPETRLKVEPKRIGLAIVHSLTQDENSGSGTVLFGSQLRIRVPESPLSSPDFGIKTKNSQPETKKLTPGSGLRSPVICSGNFPARDMVSSEDYTCVTCHGPNPRTIHIFDNCIVETQPAVIFFRSSDPFNESDSDYFPSDSFLSTCCNCNKSLGPRDDIFMYRGDRAFCSSECRSMEMMMSEENDI